MKPHRADAGVDASLDIRGQTVPPTITDVSLEKEGIREKQLLKIPDIGLVKADFFRNKDILKILLQLRALQSSFCTAAVPFVTRYRR